MATKLYLIDGTALLYRAHFAFIKNPLINSKKMNTSALFGVVNSFLYLVKSKDAEYLAISFDRKPPTFRHAIYEAYKAQRPPMPDDLVAQIEPVKRFFHLIGLPEIGLDGYEADDVLGTLAERYKAQMEVVMVTSDKDYCQLVDERATLFDPMKNVSLNPDAVFARYGVSPQQFIDYLALVGDASDNIPGVRSIGPKTAEALLKQYGSLDGIYANLAAISGKVKEKLAENKDNAYLSQNLATIIRNVPLPDLDLEELRFERQRLRAALPLLEEFEVYSIKREIESKFPATPTVAAASSNANTLTTSSVVPASSSVVPAEAGNQPQNGFRNKSGMTEGENGFRNKSGMTEGENGFRNKSGKTVGKNGFRNKSGMTTEKAASEGKAGVEVNSGSETEFQDDIFSGTIAVAEEKPEPTEPTAQAFEAVLVSSSSFVSLLNLLKAANPISLDTETDSIDPMQANLVGISLCVEPSKAYYIPLGHQLADNLSITEVLRHLSAALQNKTLIGHNLKYDLIVLSRHGLKLEGSLFDTMLAAYVLDPGTNAYSLDACALRELNHTMVPISDLIGKGKNQITFDLVDVNTACYYAAEDAWAAYGLYPIYRRKIDFSPMANLYDNIELPLVKVLQTMEMNGVAIDCGVLSEISHLINKELKQLTDIIYSYAGYEFNLNSTQQLAKLLFEEKRLPNRKKTKTGFSTDNSVLEELAEDHDIAEKLIQYRQMTKLQSTYISALPKMINPDTERIHSSFNQTVASTGRLSSSNPNLQNIPIRTQLGREIRKAFCACDDQHLILAADYSQIELRLLALMSRDEVLLEAFRNSLDIHKGMAAKIYGVGLKDVSQDQRRAAKTINFGILYGMGQRKLARELGISLSEAKSMIESYFAQFPSIRNFISQCVAKAHQEHYSETLFGRRLYLPNIVSKNQGLKSEAERVAVNMPIQGSAADIIKLAMLDIHTRLKQRKDIKMILQVHDELVFEIHKDAVEEAKQLVTNCMENALPEEWREIVQLKTDVGVGRNWFEAH